MHGRGSAASLGQTAERWGSIAVVVVVVVVVAWMTMEAAGPPHGGARKAAHADAGAASSTEVAAPASTTGTALIDAGVRAEADLDASLSLAPLGLEDAGFFLPSGAPKQVKIGVVLVTFSGAEGAPPGARSKPEALELAERLARDAQSDFHHAVSGGDPGSSDDIGRIPRGVLDPRTEVSVFALGSGSISDVLETPKGYWIVKRLD
jgi:hypothetical protein